MKRSALECLAVRGKSTDSCEAAEWRVAFRKQKAAVLADNGSARVDIGSDRTRASNRSVLHPRLPDGGFVHPAGGPIVHQ